MRPPQCKDNQRDAQPSKGFQAQICFLGHHIVNNVVESAQAGNTASDAGGHVFVTGHVNAHCVRSRRVFTHSTQLQPDPGTEQHPAAQQYDNDRQEKEYAKALQTILPACERPAIHHFRSDEVYSRIQFAHDHLHQAYAKGGQSQAGHILVCPERYRQERIDQAAEHGQEHGAQDPQEHNQERRKAALADHVQDQASASAAHAHDTGNTQVQVSGFLRQDFARGAVHKCRAESQRVNQKVQPDIHLTASFPASAWL